MNERADWTLVAERGGLLVFFFGMWTTRLIAVPGALLLMLGLCINFSEIKHRLWQSTPCKLGFLWIFYITISAFVFTALYPDYWYFHLNQGLRFVYLGGFILIALGFNRHSDLIWPCIFLSFLGFFLARLCYVFWSLWEGQDFMVVRPDLGLHTAIAMAQYSFFALMALILFFSRFLGRRHRLLRLGAWLLLFAFTCFLILISRSRSTWFLIPVLLPALMLAMVYLGKLSWRRFAFLGAVMLLVGAVVIHSYSDFVVNRLKTEADTLEMVFSGEVGEIAAATDSGKIKSIGVRVAMIRYGLQKWREAPFFGLGPGATKMLQQCCTPKEFKHLNDFHSFVPEMLLRTGLVGSLIMVLLNVVLFKAAFVAYRSGRLPGEILLLIVFGLLLHWGVALGNFRMVNYEWRFYWFMLAGLASAFTFGQPPAQERRSSLVPKS
jgi:hypothetical protein